MLSNNTIQKNRVYAPILIGIALILIVMVGYPLYTSYLDSSIEIAKLEKIKEEKKKQVEEIKKIQLLFAGSGSNDIKAKVQKYSRPFNTSNIMEALMVNRFTKSSPLTPPAITVGAISIDKGRKLPSGLSLATVSLNVGAATVDQIVDYITFLTTDSPTVFTIDSIILPLDTVTAPQDATNVSLNLSLGVYYYE